MLFIKGVKKKQCSRMVFFNIFAAEVHFYFRSRHTISVKLQNKFKSNSALMT